MISWDRVNELCEEVGQDDFLEVVEIFLEEVEEVVERLKSSPDPSTYESDLHFLKGSALNLGFDGLAALCSDGEKMARTGAPQDVNLKLVIDMYDQSKSEFLTHQKSRIAA